MTDKQLSLLVKKYLSGEATTEQAEALDRWYNDHDQNLEVYITSGPEKSEQELHDNILARLRVTLHGTPKAKVIPVWKKVASVAAVLILVLGGSYLMQKNKIQPLQVAEEKQSGSGFEKAILTTSDGRKYELGTTAHTPILEENGATISNNGNALKYIAADTGSAIVYNTLEVPRQGIYSLELADGTKVWLNALSTLHYPTSFPGKERKVSVKGEAYFEVAKNAKQPFIVEVDGGQQIEVLGTEFNVNAYSNENMISTTLLSGGIRVTAGKTQQILAPGEQVWNMGNEVLQLKKNIVAADVVAWKSGYFVCDGKDLKAILRQVCRWYDIEVEYRGEIQSEAFEGTILRDMNLNELLKVLEITGVKFVLQGNRLTVLPQ